jgi:hypothetical protein
LPCAYCQQERGYTGEHLIPASLLELFPECKFNIREDQYFMGDRIVINDVCGPCNHGALSLLDGYGSSLVSQYFVKEYNKNDELEFLYDFPLFARWTLKILFNNARREKLNTEWFEANLDYLLGNTNQVSHPFSIFGGLAVDMSPIPEFVFDNIKLGVYFNPIIVSGSMLAIEGGPVRFRNELEGINISNLLLSGLIRLGSGLFIVLLWEPEVDATYKHSIETIINRLYPHTLIIPEGKTNLRRATHAFNYQQATFNIIDSNIGMEIADQLNTFLPPTLDPVQTRREDSLIWDQHVSEIRTNRAQRREQEREKKRKKKKR